MSHTYALGAFPLYRCLNLYRVLGCVLYGGLLGDMVSHTYVLGTSPVHAVYTIMLSEYMITLSSLNTALFSMEYNIDNVNITDHIVYFVLQELTSQLVTAC